jgi:hypothetical protein
MFNNLPMTWTFFVTINDEYVSISEKFCVRPTQTKNFKEVRILMRDDKSVERAGCMPSKDFPKA